MKLLQRSHNQDRQDSFAADRGVSRPILIAVVLMIAAGFSTPKSLAAEAIPIIVPPPDVAIVTPPQATPMPNLENLEPTHPFPVPNDEIPMGYVGDRPEMNQLPPPPQSIVATSPRFRVFVLDLREDDRTNQEFLRSLVPDAFPTRYRDRSVLQVGSFLEQNKAQEFLQFLEVNGFRAEIESLLF